MLLHLLYLTLSAAAAAMIVAAALALLLPKPANPNGAGRRWWPALLGLTAGLIPGTRLAIEQWPSVPPANSTHWWFFITVGGAVLLVLLTGAIRAIVKPSASLTPAVVTALAVAAMTAFLPLAATLGRLDPQPAWMWRAAILAALPLLAAIVAAAFAHEPVASPESRSPWLRLRDEHWATLAFTLILAISPPAILFCCSSNIYLELAVALGVAWTSVAAIALFERSGLALGGAAALAALSHCVLWLSAYFFGGHDFSVLALALALAAPAALIIGTAPCGTGWTRLLAVTAAAAVLMGAPAALYGPAYLKAIRELTTSEGG